MATKEENIQLEVDRLKKKLKSVPEKNDNAGDSGARPKTIFVSRDSKKVSKLKGKPEAAGDPEIEEWVDDILNHLSTRDMSKKEQAVFIIDHLAGQAKRKIRYRFESEKTDPNKILGILCKVFGDSNPATLSKEDFFARNQRERETLLMYSQALLYLAERMIKKDTTLEASRQTLLRGKFIEGVREDLIRRELRKIDMDDKELTFCDFRDKVIKLVGDDLKHKATLVRETRAQTDYRINITVFSNGS